MRKKLIVVLVMIGIFTAATGCSLFSKPDVPNTQKAQNQQKADSNDKSKQVEDKELLTRLKKESIVKNGLVYTQNETAVAVIVAKDNVKKEDVQKLAQKYADDLRAKYKSYKVVVQALVHGKEWITITLDLK